MKTISQTSVMRQAFCGIQIKPAQHKSHGSVINAAIKAAENGAGIKRVRDFNAHLSLRTYNALTRQGVMV